MAIVITVDDVKAIAPNTGATDAAIQMQIDIATCKLDTCLEAAYADCLEVAKAIKIYVVAHFCYQASNPSGDLASRKWADGSAESYSNNTSNGNAYWDTAQSLDSAGCVESAYRSRKVFAVTGKSARYNEVPQ